MVRQIIRPVAVRDVRLVGGKPELTGDLVVPNPAEMYPDDHPLVVAYPFLFADPAEVAALKNRERGAVSVPVEQVTANPGEKRNVRRPR